VEQILSLVQQGSLAPGEKLPPERELMTMLGVSRTSLREAIRTLEIRGVVRVVPGKGTFVEDAAATQLSEGWTSWLHGHGYEVVQLLEMHEALEVKVAMLAAERATEADVAALDATVAGMQSAVGSGDHEALVLADAAFHRALRVAGKNDLITRVLDDLEDSVLDARRLVMALPNKPGRVVQEHRAVRDAVAAGDAARAGADQLALVQRSKSDILGELAARQGSALVAPASSHLGSESGRSAPSEAAGAAVAPLGVAAGGVRRAPASSPVRSGRKPAATRD
jgi:GntR family transcriptional repressor for pyruvate dehydrogenase complex